MKGTMERWCGVCESKRTCPLYHASGLIDERSTAGRLASRHAEELVEPDDDNWSYTATSKYVVECTPSRQYSCNGMMGRIPAVRRWMVEYLPDLIK